MADHQDRPGTILLVDDNRENLAALQAVLEPLGEPLVLAESGEQALRALLHTECSVILLDVRMAGMDGLQTARIIRSRPGTRHIPIIFMTAQSSELEEITRAYESGAVDYVVKPFEPEILRAKVGVFVELHRERAERVRESRARAEAEAVARAVHTLQMLSDAAMTYLDLDELAAALIERSAQLFGAGAGALLLRDEKQPGLHVRARTGAFPLPIADDRVRVGQEILGEVAATLGGAILEARNLDAEDREQAGLGDGELQSLLVVPLISTRELIGLLLLAAPDENHFDQRDLELLTLAADRMALAVDHAQRYADGRLLVETLQRSLLPQQLPMHPRMQLAARYMPAGLAPQVGGDWYDAVELDENRTAVMIGDVVGHGVRAAITMSELRNALRAFAIEGHSPEEALRRLDRVVMATRGPGMVATLLFVVIDAAAGTVTLARAGHPPPALRAIDGGVRFLETQRTLPLGVDPDQVPSQETYPMKPGETLLLFTDGLVERRGEPITDSFDRLLDALAGAPAEVEPLCEHVLRRTATEQGRDDDVAVLAVQLVDASVGSLKLRLPATAKSVTLARHRLRAWLDENAPELDPMARGDLEVAWSEACSNVVRHAYGPVDASFDATADREGNLLRMTVRDTGQWRSPGGLSGGRGLPLMEVLSDELTIDRQPGSTTVTMIRQLPAAEVPTDSSGTAILET
jgi:serine phosphatase RsbU (regulator of sigma subunit)/DNA-binding response OmpR family regulator/anti-sigma regulatory factor (Ser/Thr protein kinase)